MDKIKALIVDDSPLIRKFLVSILTEDPDIHVVGIAPNGKIALEKIERLNPDVITMDIEMPEMDGIEALKRIMIQKPTPVIMVSAHTEQGADLTFKALELGAVDFITKPDATFSRRIIDIKDELIMKIKTACKIKVKKTDKKKLAEIEKKRKITKKIKKKDIKLQKCKNIVSIGISTGGPQALTQILPTIPADINAGILIVQHMPIGFTKAFADRLESITPIHIKEAETGDIILPGHAVIARGNFHLRVKEEKLAFITKIDQEERVCLFRPSIDVLMQSTSENFKRNNIGVIMTGMAHDGVNGIHMIKKEGGKTIAQDEKSSVVYGMNKLAVESGYVDKVVPLEKIVPTILNLLK